MPCRRMFVAGSKNEPPDRLTVPASCGAASEPRAVAEMRTSPATSAARLARRGFARPSGSEPETLASRPGPAKGMRPEPWRSRPPGAVARAEASSTRAAAVAAARGQREGRDLVRGEDVGRQPFAAQLEADARVGEGAGGAAGPADRAAQAAVAGGAVDEREREGLQREVERELALAERDRAVGGGGEPGRRDARAQLEPAVRGGAAGVDRDRRQAGGAGGGGDEARRPEVEAHVRRVARPGDAGGAVDGAAEAELGADGVGDVERKRAQRHVDVEAVGDLALRRQAAVPDLERERRELDGAAADRHRRRRGEGGRGRGLADAERVERGREPAVEPGELARDVGERADRRGGCRPRSASWCRRYARPSH